ncbi:hypothetical protein D9613_012656 [Agrocybe pediades]|uniref:Uncharacterized protein n=1 Tax=Agrocybe pediades TaxID=84607 RepID=A0A8H4VQ87_9AGAR|nr:hypothetical protein D9613_012656 [Agrocybe pediades]
MWLAIVAVDDELEAGYYRNRTRNYHIRKVQPSVRVGLAFFYQHHHLTPTFTLPLTTRCSSLVTLPAHSPPSISTTTSLRTTARDDFNRRHHHYVARDNAYDNEGHRSGHPLFRGHPDRCYNHLRHRLPRYHTAFANIANPMKRHKVQLDTSYHKDEDEERVGLRNAECRVWKGSWGEQNKGGHGGESKGGCGNEKMGGRGGTPRERGKEGVAKNRRVGAE